MVSGTSSLINYVLVTEDLLHCFNDFIVYFPDPISDHCVLEFSLNLHQVIAINSVPNRNSVNLESKYQRNKSKCEEYKAKLAREDSKFNL